jgi:hypothetical protein
MANSPVSRNRRLQFFFDRTNYTAAPGATVTLTICLQELFDPRSEDSLLAPGTDGLISAGVFIESGTPRPKYPAFVRRTANILGNTRFDFAAVAQTPSLESPGASLVELSGEPVFGEVVSRRPTCETVLLPLGSFTFTTGKVAGEVTFLTAMASDEYGNKSRDRNVTYSGMLLDPLIEPAGATITVTRAAAPESLGEAIRRAAHRHP